MSSLEMEAVECASLNLGDRYVQNVKDKENMKKISDILRKPILRYGKEYFILDNMDVYRYLQH